MLLEPTQLTTFLAAAVLITVAPGPDNLMVLSLGMARGRLCGAAFGLGCAAGCLCHTLLAALGVGAVLAASPWAFPALKASGGLYLIWLGVGALRSAGARGVSARDRRPADSPGRLFVRGVVANAINPKVAIFFLAFLPQFVDAGRGGAAVQMALLGLIFALQAAAIFAAIGYFAGRVGAWLARRPGAGSWLDRIAGTVFVALGIRLIALR